MPGKDDRSASDANKDDPKAAAAAASMNDDDDVVLQKENSAWDSLEERFQQGAANGRYLDLSSDGVQELGVAEAAQSFAAIDVPNDPSTMVHTSASTSSGAKQQQQEEEPSPLLIELGGHVSRLVEKLKKARETLMMRPPRAATTVNEISEDLVDLTTTINEINCMATKLQQFVNQNSDDVSDSAVAIRRIENMNLLIHKANALISGYNNNSNHSDEVVVTRHHTYRNEDAALIYGQQSSKRTTRGRLNHSADVEAPAPNPPSFPSRKRTKKKKEPEVIVIDE